jgi:hypothetical protein
MATATKQSFIRTRYPDFPRYPRVLTDADDNFKHAWDNISGWSATLIRALEESNTRTIFFVIEDDKGSEAYQGDMMEEYTQDFFPDSDESPPLPVPVTPTPNLQRSELLEKAIKEQHNLLNLPPYLYQSRPAISPTDAARRQVLAPELLPEKNWGDYIKEGLLMASAFATGQPWLMAGAGTVKSRQGDIEISPTGALPIPGLDYVIEKATGERPPGTITFDGKEPLNQKQFETAMILGPQKPTQYAEKTPESLSPILDPNDKSVALNYAHKPDPNVKPDPWQNTSESEEIIPGLMTPAQQTARDIVEVAEAPSKGWSFRGIGPYAAQGGPIEAYQMGGLAGMMNRSMMDQRQQFNHQQGLGLATQNELWNKYRGSNRPARPPQFGGGPFGPQRPPQFPGFLGPFGPQRPPRPPQQPRLEPKTYFHEHEGGKVTYPNFPKPFVNPPDDRNPIKDPKRPKPILDQGFLPSVKEQFTTPQLEEAPRPEPYAPLEPVPPISISETTATAMEPEAVEEATQTTIEEARPVPREIDIQMPENVTATLDFPEGVRGTANYRRGGSSSSVEEQLEEDDTVTREDILNKINAIYDLDLSGYSFPDKPEVSVEDWLLYKYWPRSFKDGLYIEKLTNKYSGKDQVKHLQDQEEKYGKLPSIKMDDDILEHKGYGIDSREDYDFELPSERKFIEGYDPHGVPRGWEDDPVARHGGEVPANYRRGGLAGILKSLAPMGLGFLGSMYGNPWLGIGAGSLAGYGMAGKKRSFLDAIKGGLSGYAGTGLAQLGAMGHQRGLAGASKFTDKAREAVPASNITARGPGAEHLWEEAGKQLESVPGMTFKDVIKGYGNLAEDGLKGFGKVLGASSWPLSAGVAAASITPPSEIPEMAEIEVEQYQAMTPEQRRAYIESKRSKYKDSPFMQSPVFTPPNVDIGWQPNYAAKGGVMEIDEEMESGSFVLPADVVSNVGDGSSDSGHRRLTQLFGGGNEYARGGGTGILKGPVKGVGSGLDDLIQTGIDGVKVARLSSDEFVVPKDVVRRLGDGSQKAGSEKLYDFMKDVRLQKHGTGQQPKEIHMSGLRKMV